MRKTFQDSTNIKSVQTLTEIIHSELTPCEMKLLRAIISAFTTERENHSIILKDGKVEESLGTKKIQKDELYQILSNLGREIVIPTADETHIYWMFHTINCIRGENGYWEIEIQLNPHVSRELFDARNIKRINSLLENLPHLKSRYSRSMYSYLEEHSIDTEWSVDLLELKKILKCDQNTYNTYSRFNDLILKKCLRDIHGKTECRYAYAGVKEGRTVVAVRFRLKKY